MQYTRPGCGQTTASQFTQDFGATSHTVPSSDTQMGNEGMLNLMDSSIRDIRTQSLDHLRDIRTQSFDHLPIPRSLHGSNCSEAAVKTGGDLSSGREQGLMANISPLAQVSGVFASEGLFDKVPVLPNTADVSKDGTLDLTSTMQPTKKNTAQNFFVSSPGAISSETRDASLHQGKFDMCSVLQMQLSKRQPCLVCDISGGQIMVANDKCEELFGAKEGQTKLLHVDLFSLVQHPDQERFSTILAYLVVSEKTVMEPITISIVKFDGCHARVQAEGTQLIGLWWRIDLTPIFDG